MASSLNEESVEKKLMSVTNTQDSIQGLSLWIIHHKTNHDRIVELWSKVLKKTVKPSHRLTLFYLCNDVVQNSKRKKAPMYVETFKKHLRQATALVRDVSIKPKIERIFGIWEERQVYDKEFIRDIKTILDGKRADSINNSSKPVDLKKLEKRPMEKSFSPVGTEDFDSVQPADPSLDVKSKEKLKNKEAPSAEVLAEFKPQEMIEKIHAFKRLDSDVELKVRQIAHLKLDASSLEAVKKLKDRAHGNEFSNQFEESCQRLEEVCKGMDKKQQEQIELLALLTISEHFYDEQNREARIVTNAYKNFGARINTMKRRLEDLKRTLPDVASPIPSPSLDAPSPGNTPPYFSESNTHPVDMDLDVPGDALPGDDDIPSPPDEAPSPVSSPEDINTQNTVASSLETRIASMIPSLQSKTKLSMPDQQPIPVYVPQPLSSSSSSSRRPSANKTLTEAEIPFPDEDGGSTPLNDERAATPVMDEEPSDVASPPPPPPEKKKKENPIDFLSRLISQTQKSTSTGSSNSFLESFSLLTNKSKEPVDCKKVSSGDEDDSCSSQGPKSWAAWKAQVADKPGEEDTSVSSTFLPTTGTTLPPAPIPTFSLPPPPPPSSLAASLPPPGMRPIMPPTVAAHLVSSMTSPTQPFFQQTSPGQKENWPDVQESMDGGGDQGPSPNIIYPPVQGDVPPPPFPPLGKASSQPIKGILRKSSQSVLKELTPSVEDMPPPPPPPSIQSAVSIAASAILTVSSDTRPPIQPPSPTVPSVVGRVIPTLGSGSKDEAQEFMEKLKRKTTVVTTTTGTYTPNPVRPNLMTLTPGSDGDDAIGEMDMDLEEEEEEEDESASEGETSRPKGIPVLSSVVRRVDHSEKLGREKDRSRDSGSQEQSLDSHDSFLKDRRYSRRSSDTNYSTTSSADYGYRDGRHYEGYGPAQPQQFFSPYPQNPYYSSDPYAGYVYGPTPPKRPYNPNTPRRSNYHY